MNEPVRELFESLTRRQQFLLLEAIGTIPRWVLSDSAIKRAAASPVVFMRSYFLRRRDGMPIRESIYWSYRLTKAFCL